MARYSMDPLRSPGNSFAKIPRNRFPDLDERDQCRVAELLGYLCCAADNTLTIPNTKRNGSVGASCSYCQGVSGSRDAPICLDAAVKKQALILFDCLIQLPSFVSSRRPRIVAMVALRNLARHCREDGFLDVEASAAAQWCLKSLQSSVRELRIASR